MKGHKSDLIRETDMGGMHMNDPKITISRRIFWIIIDYFRSLYSSFLDLFICHLHRSYSFQFYSIIVSSQHSHIYVLTHNDDKMHFSQLGSARKINVISMNCTNKQAFIQLKHVHFNANLSNKLILVPSSIYFCYHLLSK